MDALRATRERVLDQRAEALAVSMRRIDAARAVWRGLVIVAHRRSAMANEVCWALPGRGWSYGNDLLLDDPAFRVLSQPSASDLAQARQALCAA